MTGRDPLTISRVHAGDELRLRRVSGNQPPRTTWVDVVVTRIEEPKPGMHAGRVHYVVPDRGSIGLMDTARFLRHARRQLDPSVVGPGIDVDLVEQPALF